jgi:glutathione S-transferase
METLNELNTKFPWVSPGPASDKDALKNARTEWVEKTLPRYAKLAIKRIGNGPFLLGEQMCIADLTAWSFLNNAESGNWDHISKDLYKEKYPALHKYFETLSQHSIIKNELAAAPKTA